MNANVVTMEPDGKNYTSVEVESGIITNVNNSTTIEEFSSKNAMIIDLKGKTILPGFIDSHSHWIGDRSLTGNTSDEIISLALSQGWTSISELFVNQDRLDELIRLDSEERLKLRVNAYLPINYQEQRFGNWYQAYEPHQELSDKVRIGGVKLFMDNGPSIGYKDRTIWFTADELNPIVKEAHDLGYQIAIHSGIDNATDLALDAIEAAQSNNPEGIFRHRIEHANLLRDDQISRLLELKTIVSAQLLWRTSDDLQSPILEPIKDNYTLGLISRWRDVIDAGVTFIGSTDTPYYYGTGGSLKAIYRAATRIGDQGIIPPDWMLNQRITIEEAIRSITIDAAYGTVQEDVKGSIRIGKMADLVVLSSNPFTSTPEDLLDISVEMTIIGGQVMYCAEGLEDMCEGEYTEYTDSNSTTSQNLTFPILVIFLVLFFKGKGKKDM
jgi:predicted amidohydrolase YtcJ